jgi:hypothetical protein
VILNSQEQKKVHLVIKSDLPQETSVELSVNMSNSSLKGQRTEILFVDRRNVSIFILTDKPTFRPEETVKVGLLT